MGGKMIFGCQPLLCDGIAALGWNAPSVLL